VSTLRRLRLDRVFGSFPTHGECHLSLTVELPLNDWLETWISLQWGCQRQAVGGGLAGACRLAGAQGACGAAGVRGCRLAGLQACN
jgi:hypothetical protein